MLPLGTSVFDHEVATLDPASTTQSLEKSLVPAWVGVGGAVCPQEAYSRDLGRLLRLGDERRKRETDSENDREPDPPHGHLGRMASGSLADLNYGPSTQKLAALVEHGLLDDLVRPQPQRLR